VIFVGAQDSNGQGKRNTQQNYDGKLDSVSPLTEGEHSSMQLDQARVMPAPPSTLP
jgi:hypothetical protein